MKERKFAVRNDDGISTNNSNIESTLELFEQKCIYILEWSLESTQCI